MLTEKSKETLLSHDSITITEALKKIDENVFDDRKIALKRIRNAEQKYPQVSGETYYEEY